ncbi:MAG: glutamate mutase L [Deltaproteobacteria bacterium]|nr:glutamate mutase L [bacterium]MCB9479906.1 glutamate mutase L [Deltaproteobacteria bacterium]MCB9489695.1 glutamate mutase L [Deltaproteobacteria bacterium]
MGRARVAINPADIKVILATDCGSTTTKAILIQKIGDEYRQTHRGEAPTTVEAPFEDVTMGVLNAVTEVGELAGRRLVDDEGNIIRPATETEGCDIYISTSSAGGGLQMMVAGVVRKMTAESAERAALGAGSIVMDVICSNDHRLPHQQIERIRQLRPDMILLSGGIDGGTQSHVVELAQIIAAANPRPRLGSDYNLPVIYAGNKDAREHVAEELEKKTHLFVVDNLRPVLEQENLAPAREKIHELFMEHVMAQAPGYAKLMAMTDAPIMPTPAAVGNILKTIAEQNDINAVCVDIGGATTDVFSVFDKQFNRTVSANLGMSYSISNVFAEAGLANIARWVPYDLNEQDLRDNVKNKMIRPTTIPQSMGSLVFEQAIAKEALRLAFIQHKSFATSLKGVQQQRTIGDVFSQETAGETLVDMMKLDLLVGSGGVLSHAPRMSQTAMMLIDSFQPTGFTRLAKDSIFMMPHLGVAAQVHPEAATEVFTKDCLVFLGTCLCPVGSGKAGKETGTYSIKFPDGKVEEGALIYNTTKVFPLPDGQTAQVTFKPARGFDVGGGKGQEVTREVHGGEVGLILDGRPRPIVLPEKPADRVAELQAWMSALDAYPMDRLHQVAESAAG